MLLIAGFSTFRAVRKLRTPVWLSAIFGLDRRHRAIGLAWQLEQLGSGVIHCWHRTGAGSSNHLWINGWSDE
jgi:hypothetical protein